MEKIVRELLLAIGEDPSRDGLRRTPIRFAEALRELTRGYHEDPHQTLREAVFDLAHDQMVVCRDIQFYSLCEHHLLPFFGKCHIGYIPRGHVVGLSKLVRVVNTFARRLQVQEQLTRQIAEAINVVLEPEGVGVVMEATHLCLAMRSVQQDSVGIATSAMLGRFEVHKPTREEFLHHVDRTRNR